MSDALERSQSPQAAAESSERGRKLVEVVPDGDVLLKVGRGADAVDIRVSGTVISLASDVFSRMLSSSYLEARTKEVVLAEDDPEVILDFCNIVHHKAENLDHCDTTRLSFMDKDRDRNAVHSSRIVLKDFPLLNIGQCIGVAAVFRFADLFWFATKHAVLSWGSCRLRSPERRMPSFTDTALFASGRDLEEELEKVRTQRLHGFLDDVFKCVGKGFDTGAFCPSSLQKRGCSFAKYSTVMFYLAKKGIKPGQAGTCQKSISQAMNAVRDLDRQWALSPWDQILMYSGCRRGLLMRCDFCRRNIADDLFQVVERHMKTAPGVCLVCYTGRREKFFHNTRNHEKH
ncbi:uncharacterized protein PV07_11816 [Cladophialophora immunda]|uniref:BTB domain-containing protein n=1 Tax=Cladophialophora immunda TaxID=569365 RepID=A0A0D2BZ85_9EURO|nr:uncharacterized protein PV07_11816 [Cladophialophora immunda]KIW23630.1 hypothetical protein PV07_11816 [Cladophialophora immunda]